MFVRVLVPCRLAGSLEDGDSMFLRNFDTYLRVYSAPNPRRMASNKTVYIKEKKYYVDAFNCLEDRSRRSLSAVTNAAAFVR
jgi:hypothetical protein